MPQKEEGTRIDPLVSDPSAIAAIPPATAPPDPPEDPPVTELPLRTWAVNDLMFSGHVAEFLILFLIVRRAPVYVTGGLIVWQLAQAYALLATRDHYLVDMLVAVPFAILCERLGTAVVRRLAAKANAASDEPLAPAA